MEVIRLKGWALLKSYHISYSPFLWNRDTHLAMMITQYRYRGTGVESSHSVVWFLRAQVLSCVTYLNIVPLVIKEELLE